MAAGVSKNKPSKHAAFNVSDGKLLTCRRDVAPHLALLGTQAARLPWAAGHGRRNWQARHCSWGSFVTGTVLVVDGGALARVF